MLTEQGKNISFHHHPPREALSSHPSDQQVFCPQDRTAAEGTDQHFQFFHIRHSEVNSQAPKIEVGWGKKKRI